MNEEQFHKIDDELMKKTSPLRERKVNPKLLAGFSASVERKIALAKEPEPARAGGWRVAVPVFAVLVLAFVLVAPRIPGSTGSTGLPAATVMELAQLPSSGSDPEAALAEEIEALKELGVWTDEDEQTAGVSSEEEEIAELLG